jgi:hypothetical protein
MMVVPDLLLLPLAAYIEATRIDPQAALTGDEFSALFLVSYSLLAKILPLGGKVVPVSYAHVSKNLKVSLFLLFPPLDLSLLLLLLLFSFTFDSSSLLTSD